MSIPGITIFSGRKNYGVPSIEEDNEKTTPFQDKCKKVLANNQIIHFFDGRFIIYLPSRGTNGMQWNGVFKDKDGNEIVCRHISEYVIRNIKKVFDLTPEVFQNSPELQNTKKLEENFSNWKELRLLRIDSFGEELKNILQNMPPEGVSYRLLTTNHAMVVRLREKLNGIAIIVYDPNNTKTYSRCLAADPDAVKSLKLNYFLPNDYVLDFYTKWGWSGKNWKYIALALLDEKNPSSQPTFPLSSIPVFLQGTKIAEAGRIIPCSKKIFLEQMSFYKHTFDTLLLDPLHVFFNRKIIPLILLFPTISRVFLHYSFKLKFIQCISLTLLTFYLMIRSIINEYISQLDSKKIKLPLSALENTKEKLQDFDEIKKIESSSSDEILKKNSLFLIALSIACVYLLTTQNNPKKPMVLQSSRPNHTLRKRIISPTPSLSSGIRRSYNPSSPSLTRIFNSRGWGRGLGRLFRL